MTDLAHNAKSLERVVKLLSLSVKLKNLRIIVKITSFK